MSVAPPHTTLLKLLVFSLYVLQYGLAQQSPSPSPTNIPLPSPSPLPFLKGRLFHISSDSVMSKLLKNDENFINSTKIIQDYAAHVETGILKFLLGNKAPPANQSLHPCNHDDEVTRSSMKAFLENRYLPEPDTSCITDLEGTRTLPEEEPPFTTNEIYETVITRADTMLARAQEISDKILGNWTTTDVNIHYLYNTTSKRCVINHIGSMRIFDKWYIFTTITNAPRRVSVPLFHRQWLNEFIHIKNDGKIGEPLHFSAWKRPIGDEEHILINDTTTTLSSTRGFAGPYAFNSMYPEENPALISASDKSDLSVQQADDALAPSSLAILLLPLALNLIPVALLADVTTGIMLFYAVVTDVITVIPLGVKGIELLVIGRQRHRSVVIRLTSSVNGTRSDSAVMEMWAAQCRSRESVTTVGIIFISLAIAFMVLGVVLEVTVRRFVKRRKLIRNLLLVESEPLLSQSPPARPVLPEENDHAQETTSNNADINEPPVSKSSSAITVTSDANNISLV